MRKNVHVCLHHFVCAVSKGFEPSRAERMLTYHGDRRSCGGTGGQEMCFLAVLRNGDGLVLRTENTEVRKTKSE
jgi:hypothetical protein